MFPGYSMSLSFPSKNILRFFWPALLLLASWGCYTLDVERAFDGKFKNKENNRIINEYCQSCHIHRDFDPRDHVESMQKLYRRVIFRTTKECRVCHYIEKIMARNEFIRRTRRPREVRRGKHRAFEKEIAGDLKRKKESKTKEGKSFFGLF